ncbi:uncharacterized protein [Venturia canescens]|uniref:uncharacterized protein n=1 Tax=Venturia canescens TaxID=32260 RepID=UPI001C9C818D|nr:uncharacterized protein LOC122413192 [Venturia canescens]
MYMIKILCAWIFLCFGIAKNAPERTNWLDNLAKRIVEKSKFRQVRLLTRLDENEHLQDPIVEDLIIKLMYHLPTVRINYGKDFQIPGKSRAKDIIDPRFPFDTTATLFLLIVESLDTSTLSMAKRFIDVVANMASFHYSPKFILITSVTDIRNFSLEELLEYAWSQRLLSFTILELPEKKTDARRWRVPKSDDFFFGPNDSRSTLPIIHELNPFKKEYTRIKWTRKDGHELFPNKVGNMWGHPLRIRALDIPPFSIAKFNEDGEPIEIKGSNMELIKVLADRLNASIKWIPQMENENLYNIDDPFRVVYNLMELEKIDMESYLAPQYSVSTNNTLRTTSVLMDKFCAIVPIIYQVKVPISIEMCKAYLLSCALVLTFWLLAKFLHFDASFWKTFNICRVLFFVPIGIFPKTNAERMIFASLLVTAGIISTNLYTSLTDISLETTLPREMKTFENLDDSGLIPIISSFFFNKTFGNVTGALLNLKNKAKTSMRSQDCPAIAAKYKNVTCCLATLGVDLKAGNESNAPTLQIAQPCFWYDSTAFTIGKRSPFRSHINYIIWNLHSAGFIKIWYEDRESSRQLSFTKPDAILEKRFNPYIIRVILFAIIIVGYSTSMLVLLAEIIIHSALKRFKSIPAIKDK